jgi:hypothetical protein
MTIHFYSPGIESRTPLPTDWRNDWSFLGDGLALDYQYYFALFAAGLDVKFSETPYKEGVVFAHAAYLLNLPQPPPQTYWICLQLDWPRNPWAQAHLVANSFQLSKSALTLPERFFTGHRYFLTHLPQVGLIPRDASRAETFETVSYFGLEKNLAAPFPTKSWRNQLKKLGLEWHLATSPADWKDYSKTDAVLAIRDTDTVIKSKPAQKLYNAWIAGVIPLMGPEIGFREAGISGHDYLEVRNAEEALAALKVLKENPELRKKLLENGRKQADRFQIQKITSEWATQFRNKILPDATKWLAQPLWRRKLFCSARKFQTSLRGLKSKLHPI